MRSLHLSHFAPAIRGAPPCTPLDLTLEAGETVAVLGPSGAGKSSLLRAIAGLVPASGDIRIGDRAVTALPPEQRGAVYLHQTPRLFPHLDVAGNIAFPMRLRSITPAVIAATTDALLAQIRLGTFGDRQVTSLSGGEQQRVALARAIAAAPDLLLLDEPFAALDPSLRTEVRDALVTLMRPNPPTTLLVTHDPEEAAALSSRVAVMLAGTVVQLSSPRVLFDAPGTLAVAAFLGVENRWSRADAASVLVEALPAVAGAQHVAIPAVALAASATPGGRHRVVQVRETRHGQRVEGVTEGVAWVATARDGLEVGSRIEFAVESRRVLYYDAAARLMAAR